MMIVVAGALVDPQGNILVARRPVTKAHGGLWEFPGGKLDDGETLFDALFRELREELDIVVDHAAATPVTFSTHAGRDSELLLMLYAVSGWSGEPRPIEHMAIDWRKPHDLGTLAMPPADRALLPELVRWLSAISAAGAARPGS